MSKDQVPWNWSNRSQWKALLKQAKAKALVIQGAKFEMGFSKWSFLFFRRFSDFSLRRYSDPPQNFGDFPTYCQYYENSSVFYIRRFSDMCFRRYSDPKFRRFSASPFKTTSFIGRKVGLEFPFLTNHKISLGQAPYAKHLLTCSLCSLICA